MLLLYQYAGNAHYALYRSKGVSHMFEALSFPVSLHEIPHPVLAEKHIPGRKAVVRTDTNEVLNIVSARYPLIPHADVFNAMESAIQTLGLPITKRDEKSAYSGGSAKVVWTLDKSFVLPDHDVEDKLDVTITARNSYNYSSVVVLELGTRRLICTNGMTVGKLFAGTKKRHVPSIQVPELIKQITAVLERVDDVQKRMISWGAVEYPRDRMSAWLESHPIAKPARQEILDYFTAQPDRARAGGHPRYTGWEAVNAVTWFATHRVKTRNANTLMLAEERMLELAQVFTKEELESSARKRNN